MLDRADVTWGLSIRQADLPSDAIANGRHAYRQLTMGAEEFDFSSGFDDLHSHVYGKIINGDGFGVTDARPSIELVHRLRTIPLSK